MHRHLVLIGGSRGLGKVFAELATRQNHLVSVVSRTPVAGLPGRHFACDITQQDQTESAIKSVVSAHGEIHGLVFFQRYRGNQDLWSSEVETSVTGMKRVVELAAQHVAIDGSGAMVFVSSMNAFFISPELPCGYHIAKTAICQMARYYACHLGSRGIRVNAVCPSTFIKPENQEFYSQNPENAKRLAQMSPLNRMGTSTDVANTILFLLSENAAFITGQSLVVDGGISLRWPEHQT